MKFTGFGAKSLAFWRQITSVMTSNRWCDVIFLAFGPSIFKIPSTKPTLIMKWNNINLFCSWKVDDEINQLYGLLLTHYGKKIINKRRTCIIFIRSLIFFLWSGKLLCMIFNFVVVMIYCKQIPVKNIKILYSV